MTHQEHHPALPRAQASERELEEIHNACDDILLLLAELRDLLEALVESQS